MLESNQIELIFVALLTVTYKALELHLHSKHHRILLFISFFLCGVYRMYLPYCCRFDGTSLRYTVKTAPFFIRS